MASFPRLPTRSCGRLFRHDWMVLRNGFAAAFASLRDRVLLAVMIGLAALWLARSGPLGLDWPSIATASLAFGAWVQDRLHHTIAAFVADSPLAVDALEASTRHGYFAAWHGIAILTTVLLAASIAPGWLSIVLPVYIAGAGLVVAWRALRRVHARRRAAHSPAPIRTSGHRSAWRALAWSAAERQVGAGFRRLPPSAMILIASVIAVAAATILDMVASPGIAVTAFVLSVLGLIAWSSRVDHALIQFAASAGHGAFKSVAALSAASMLLGLMLVALSLPLGPARFASLAAIIVAGGLFVLALRVLAYRLYAKRRADMILSIGIFAAALLATAAPLLVPALAAGAFAVLGARARDATWIIHER